MASEPENQRIGKLTPLADVLARIERDVRPVAPRHVDTRQAAGCTLAADVIVGPCPRVPVALRDGWAVPSGLTGDAGAYSPVMVPAAVPVEAGDPMPSGTDAVVPFETARARAGGIEITVPMAAGDGVLGAGADAQPRTLLARVGAPLTPVQALVAHAAEVTTVTVRRPRVRLVHAGSRADALLDGLMAVLAGKVAPAGGEPVRSEPAGESLSVALTDAAAAAVIGIGGTGSGRRDAAVRMLARAGSVVAHGIALTPGETTAFGLVGSRPVLLLPGRIDAALAAWLALGRTMVGRLCGRVEEDAASPAVLTRKIASPLGLAEIVPVRRRDGKAEPIASGYWPLTAVAQSDGWIWVPPDSEGFPVGSTVVIRPWA